MAESIHSPISFDTAIYQTLTLPNIPAITAALFAFSHLNYFFPTNFVKSVPLVAVLLDNRQGCSGSLINPPILIMQGTSRSH